MGLCRFVAAILVLFLNLTCAVSVEAQAAHRVWYVSPAGTGEDGSSWKKAWKDLAKINWNNVLPGDTVFIDGGTNGITYTSSLKVQTRGTAAARIFIKQSIEGGHSGTITIGGQSIGIEIPNCAYISVIGSRWRGIIVTNCSFAGVKVSGTGATAAGNVLQNIEVNNCGSSSTAGSGIDFSGDQLSLNHVIAHDNFQSNIKAFLANQNYAYGALNLKLCWVYNSKTTLKSDGVAIDGGSSARPRVYMNDCILGPGLGQGAKVGVQSTCGGDGVLFVNASRSNMTAMSNSSSGAVVSLVNATSFLAKTNAEGQSHSFIDGPGQPVRVGVNSSIVFGGAVLLKPGSVGSNNFQFRTTGNTTALSPKMVNPLFSDTINNFTKDVNNNTLINTDFAVPYYPTLGAGARVTSVAELLSY